VGETSMRYVHAGAGDDELSRDDTPTSFDRF
jgi:hypothetical protein